MRVGLLQKGIYLQLQRFLSRICNCRYPLLDIADCLTIYCTFEYAWWASSKGDISTIAKRDV